MLMQKTSSPHAQAAAEVAMTARLRNLRSTHLTILVLLAQLAKMATACSISKGSSAQAPSPAKSRYGNVHSLTNLATLTWTDLSRPALD